MVPQAMSKHLSLKYLQLSNNSGTLDYAVQKLLLGGPFGEVPGGWDTPTLCQSICILNIHLYHKKTGSLALAV